VTSEELDAVAAVVLERAISAGRLAARPRPETLTVVADIIRPALSDAEDTKNDRRPEHQRPAVVGGHGNARIQV
jgi:hypothetical protein